MTQARFCDDWSHQSRDELLTKVTTVEADTTVGIVSVEEDVTSVVGASAALVERTRGPDWPNLV